MSLRASHLTAVAALAVALTATSTVSAGVDWQINIPSGGDPFGNFFSFQYLGPAQGTVTNAHLNLTFTTIGNFDAADLDIELLAPVIAPDGFTGVLYIVSGADLGWSGQGTFTASIDIKELTGQLNHPSGFPNAIWLMDVGNFDSKPPLFFGTFTDSSFTFDIAPVPAPAGLALLGLAGLIGSRRRRRHD